jgi:hypothetical protein
LQISFGGGQAEPVSRISRELQARTGHGQPAAIIGPKVRSGFNEANVVDAYGSDCIAPIAAIPN